MKACDFIARYLYETAGIQTVFTYAGGTSAMLLNSIARETKMTIVPMRHEGNVALAAEGYARIKRTPGLALAMSGPGATNMITGMAQAYFDSTPVLFLTGNVTTGTFKYDRPVRQYGYQETDIVPVAKPVTKNALFVDRIDMVAGCLRSALRQAVEDRPGPVLYDIPFDTQKQEVDEKLLKKAFTLPASRRLRAEDAEGIMSILTASQRPILLLGGGIQGAGVADSVKRFAELYNLPVVVSLLGKDAISNESENYIGFIGAYGNRSANWVLDAADTVIALGTRIDSRQTASIKAFERNKRVIHVDIDPDVIGSTVNTDLGIQIDLKSFFLDYFEYVKGAKSSWKTPADWWKAIARVREILAGDGEANKGPLNPRTFLRRLSQTQQAGTIYTTDVGNNQMWGAKCYQLKTGDRMLSSGGLGTMGYAIPAAIGAHFANPSAPVVAMMGDGGLQMAINELSTISARKLPIKLVVLNNGVLGLMKNFQDENYDGLNPATVDGYAVPDIVRVSEAYGIPARKVSSDADVEKSLQWLNSGKGPMLLEVEVPVEWGPQAKVRPGGSLLDQQPELSEEKNAQLREALK